MEPQLNNSSKFRSKQATIKPKREAFRSTREVEFEAKKKMGTMRKRMVVPTLTDKEAVGAAGKDGRAGGSWEAGDGDVGVARRRQRGGTRGWFQSILGASKQCKQLQKLRKFRDEAKPTSVERRSGAIIKEINKKFDVLVTKVSFEVFEKFNLMRKISKWSFESKE
uniref:Uncharacterized protein n=1 Tax=Oryza glumipatula TaxID=40148 RepID=A0A0D9ZVI7_9ORYZ